MEKKADKEKWSNLLCQTISAMCKKSIIGQEVVRVQGLVGITLCNNEVFLVDVSEHFEADAFDQQSTQTNNYNHSHDKSFNIDEFNDMNDTDTNENENIQIITPKFDENQDNWENTNNQSSNITNSFSNNQSSNINNNFSNNQHLNNNNHYSNNQPINNSNHYSNNQEYNFSNHNNNNFKEPVNPPPPSSSSSQFDSLNQLQSFTTKQLTPPVKRTRAKKEFSRTLATTKHTAEILSYQDFTPFSSRPYTCKLCDACFSKRFCLANHIVTVHQVGGKYVCEMCSRQFLQRNRYMLHIEKHSNEGSRLVCPECGKNFTIKNNYQHHLSICTGYNNYKNKNNNNDSVNNKNNKSISNNRNNNNTSESAPSNKNNDIEVKSEIVKRDLTLTFESFDDVMNEGGGEVGVGGGGEELELIDSSTPIKQEDLAMFGIPN